MNWKRIYAMELGSEIVKIGVSKDVAQRTREVQREYGKKVKRVAYTEPLPREFAYEFRAGQFNRFVIETAAVSSSHVDS